MKLLSFIFLIIPIFAYSATAEDDLQTHKKFICENQFQILILKKRSFELEFQQATNPKNLEQELQTFLHDSRIGKPLKSIYDEFKKKNQETFPKFLDSVLSFSNKECFTERQIADGSCEKSEVDSLLSYLRATGLDLTANHRGRAVIVSGTENTGKQAANLLAGFDLASSSPRDKLIYPEYLNDPTSRTYSIYSGPAVSKDKPKAKGLAAHFFTYQIIKWSNAAQLLIAVNEASIQEELPQVLKSVGRLVGDKVQAVSNIGFIVSVADGKGDAKVTEVSNKLKTALQAVAGDAQTSANAKTIANLLAAKEDLKNHVAVIEAPEKLKDDKAFEESKKLVIKLVEEQLQFLPTGDKFFEVLSDDEKKLSDCAVKEIRKKIPENMKKVFIPVQQHYEKIERDSPLHLESSSELFGNALQDLIGDAFRNVTKSRDMKAIFSSLATRVEDFSGVASVKAISEIQNDAMFANDVGLSYNKEVENGFIAILKYFLDSRRWYFFLVKMNVWVSKYETMKDMAQYEDSGKSLLVKLREKKAKKEDVVKLISDVKSLPQEPLKKLLGDLSPGPRKLISLQYLVRIMFTTQLNTMTCAEGVTICKGSYVFLSSCLAYECPNRKGIKLYATNQVYLDKSFTSDGKTLKFLAIFSPLWQVVGSISITLDGVEGGKAGHFFGVAEMIFSPNSAVVSAAGVGEKKSMKLECADEKCTGNRVEAEGSGKTSGTITMIFVNKEFKKLTHMEKSYRKSLDETESTDKNAAFRQPFLALFFNSYKTFVRSHLEARPENTQAERFLKKIGETPEIDRLYNTYAFGDDFKKLEEQSFNLKNQVLVAGHFQSLLQRIANYSNSVKGQKEELQMLMYVSTGILGRLAGERNNNKLVVINLSGFLDLVLEDFKHLKDLRSDQNVINYRDDFLRNVKSKSDEAHKLVQNEIVPVINKYTSKLSGQIDALAQEVVNYKKANRVQKKELEEKRSKLKLSIIWKKFMGILAAVTAFMSFLDAKYVSTGMVMYASAVLGEEFYNGGSDSSGSLRVMGLNSVSQAADDAEAAIEKVPDVVKANLEKIHAILNKKKKVLSARFSDIEKALKDASSNEDINSIKMQVQQAVSALDQIDTKSLDPTTITKINKIRDDFVGILALKKTEVEKSGKKYTSKVIELIIRLEAIIDVPDSINVPDEDTPIVNSAALEEVNRNIKSNAETFKLLEAYEERIYSHMLPIVSRVSGQLTAAAQRSRGQSKAYLDVQAWKIDEYMNDVIRAISKMTTSFDSNEEFDFILSKCKRGMAAMMNVYHSIADNQDKAELAAYLSGINSNKATSQKFTNPELAKLQTEMEITIQNNLVLEGYERGRKAFMQSLFPFGGEFIPKDYKLPKALVLEKTSKDLVDFASERTMTMKKNIQSNSGVITKFDENIHAQATFDLKGNALRPPFYTWKYEDNKRAISYLLQGRTVEMIADINDIGTTNNDRIAVKFKDIRFALVPRDESQTSKVNEIMNELLIKLTTLGTFDYKCKDKYYQINNNVFTMVFSHLVRGRAKRPAQSNEVYKKITKNDPIFSPYGAWNVTLYNESEDAEELLKQIKDIPFDLQLYGKGFYVAKNSKICESKNLDKYYTRNPADTVNLEEDEDIN